jgi:hypothetical protein
MISNRVTNTGVISFTVKVRDSSKLLSCLYLRKVDGSIDRLDEMEKFTSIITPIKFQW